MVLIRTEGGFRGKALFGGTREEGLYNKRLSCIIVFPFKAKLTRTRNLLLRVGVDLLCWCDTNWGISMYSTGGKARREVSTS